MTTAQFEMAESRVKKFAVEDKQTNTSNPYERTWEAIGNGIGTNQIEYVKLFNIYTETFLAAQLTEGL